MQDLKGKRVLFIAPIFYNYHNEIINTLKKFGAEVDFYAERSYSLFYEVSKKVSKFQHNRNINNYLENILFSLSDGYDFVFIIRGEILTVEFLKKLREKNLNAKFIMYQWDTSVNNLNFLKLIPFFDKVLTFDRPDAIKYSIDYLPLFYIDIYKNLVLESQKKYDIVFFGGFHSDRLNIVKKVDSEAKKLGLSFKHHLFISPIILIKKFLFSEIKISDFKYIKLYSVSNYKILDTYKKSKSVLDIEYNGQNGYTIRTFETLGSGLKLITTNGNILNEDFFDSSQIYFLDRNNIKLDKKFFISENRKIRDIQLYAIDEWIKNIFC